ncbi:amidohydrolase [Myceligenerans salitolerans]|uniref:Amidohydrolase family protein n=1 Tax=Myceligenerans salitolerans TaxID=1230528 RepID=A0ABS3I8Z5_9MICO|nr:amidohydrolase family protein [Myceligenerans salitolerans]MBO0609501.1 amidohydrolase family protein [Myceligenerans salitolerans]
MTSLILSRARVPGAEHLVDIQISAGTIARIVPSSSAGTGHGGRSESAAGPRPAAPEIVDLDGRWVLPGLWDAHTHMEQWALVRRRLDVAPATSAEHAVRLVRDALDTRAAEGAADADEPLVGFGLHWVTWPEPPTAEMLDAVGDVPVVLLSFDLHSAWVNTAGLRRLGLEHPTGLLLEDEMLPAEQLDHPSGDTLDRLVQSAAQAAAARGVVGVVDFGMDDNIGAWRRRVPRWEGLRVRAGVWYWDLDAALAEGLRTGDPLHGTGEARGTTDGSRGSGPRRRRLVEMGSLKVISDGSLNSRTACCFDPYEGSAGPEAHGMLNVPPEELQLLMKRATDGGLTCAIHAIGDRANALALDAFEITGARGSIEHAQLVRWSDVERFAAGRVTASVQPEHAMDDRDVAEGLWPDRTDRAFPLATLAAAGVPLALGSDAPVARLDPWFAISSAVTRSRGGREPWHPEQVLTVEQALEASTAGRGTTPREGGPADLAVLDGDMPGLGAQQDYLVQPADPSDISEALRTMPVAGTLLDGEWTHRAL